MTPQVRYPWHAARSG